MDFEGKETAPKDGAVHTLARTHEGFIHISGYDTGMHTCTLDVTRTSGVMMSRLKDKWLTYCKAHKVNYCSLLMDALSVAKR